MDIATSGLAQLMSLPDWRGRLADRRAMVRSVVELVLERGEGQLEGTLEEVKRALVYYSLSDRDRSIVRTTFKDIRTLVRGWGGLSLSAQTQFRSGELAPSTLAARIRSKEVGA